MNKSKLITSLILKDPTLTNRVIAGVVGCTRRMVRHVRQNLGVEVETTMPKILLYDVETAPMEVYVWHLWKNVVNPGMVIKGISMLSWSAKWLFDEDIMGEVVTPKEAHAREDASILLGLWKLMDEADIVIAHNGLQFDNKIANARFLTAGMAPPMPYRTIDTLRATKRVFKFPSFTLNELNTELGLGKKMETGGIDLWRRCVNHDKDALSQMLEYNKIDTLILEELYLKVRPWLRGHPNVALYINTEEQACTNCGNEDLQWGGYYYTPAGKYKSFRCNGCGAIGRSRLSDLDKETRAKLLLSVAA